GVPAGAVCAVAEADAAIDSTTLATSWTVDGNSARAADLTWGGVELKNAVKTTAVKEGAQVSVSATNTYTDAGKAGFSVTKKLSGADAVALAGTKFSFDYTCTAEGSDDVKGTFELAAGETFSSVEAGVELVRGASCVVSEREPGAVEGLRFDGVTFDRVSGEGEFASDKAGARVSFTLGDVTKPVVYTATNTYVPVNDKPVNPEIATTLTSNGLKAVDLTDAKDDDTVTFTDTVVYKNLRAGETYYLEGSLVDGSGQQLPGMRAVSSPIKAQGREGALVNGTGEMTFTLPVALLKDADKVVAFEKIWASSQLEKQPVEGENEIAPKTGETPIATHEDVNDEGQTVTLKHPTAPADQTIELTKVVEGAEAGDREFAFTLACGEQSQDVALKAGAKTQLKAKAGAQCTLSEKDADIEGYSSQVSFAGRGLEVTSKDRTATFTVPAAASAALEVVAKNTYAPVEEPTPEIGTVASNDNASDADNGKELVAGQDARIRDVMTWHGLKPGTYVMVPSLMSNANGQAEKVEGTQTAPVAFEVKEGETSGEVTATITVPAEKVVPHATFVVFEKVYAGSDVTPEGVIEGATPVATHEDINDEGQTVTVGKPSAEPASVTLHKVVTNAPEGVDREFSFDLVCRSGSDVVEKKGLTLKAGAATEAIEVPAGAQCVLTEDADAATIDDATATLSVTTDSSLVEAVVEGLTATFTMPAGDGVAINVTAENTYPTPEVPTTPATPDTPDTPATPDNPCEVIPPAPSQPVNPGEPTEPTNPTQPGQPTEPATPDTPGTPASPEQPTLPEECQPTVKTIASNGHDGSNKIGTDTIATILDVVEWSNLAPGEYVVNGVLMDKTAKTIVAGQQMQAAGRITVSEWGQSGKVQMVVTVPANVLKPGHSYVMFEKVYRADDADANGIAKKDATPVVEHADINDAAQTVVADEPETPDVPVPSQPTTPATPDTPGTPATPDTPMTPGTPA
ncbi:MAG: VaFE repeat-containing surface-anchored protein, partial [Actinomycetaceae bacterium]|nr:VaFE repeat-containing surface-anchored protein [Actinomycetaceae bacterium]